MLARRSKSRWLQSRFKYFSTWKSCAQPPHSQISQVNKVEILCSTTPKTMRIVTLWIKAKRLHVIAKCLALPLIGLLLNSNIKHVLFVHHWCRFGWIESAGTETSPSWACTLLATSAAHGLSKVTHSHRYATTESSGFPTSLCVSRAMVAQVKSTRVDLEASSNAWPENFVPLRRAVSTETKGGTYTIKHK